MVTLYRSSDNELEDTPYKSVWQAAVLFTVPPAFHGPHNLSYEHDRFCDLNANEEPKALVTPFELYWIQLVYS